MSESLDTEKLGREVKEMYDEVALVGRDGGGVVGQTQVESHAQFSSGEEIA